jgi:anti-sigma factor RsiW
MSEPHDEMTEYLLEEYALDRLRGEGLARVEELLREQPALRARVAELREEAGLLSDALRTSATERAPAVPDSTLALFIDGALDELERASLEVSLAGDIRAQASLSALYREVNAVLNDEPSPEQPQTSELPATVLPFDPGATEMKRPVDVKVLLASVALGAISLLVPPAIGVPLLFLALGAFGWWATRSKALGHVAPSDRMRSPLGLVPSLILFATGLFAGPLALWCYVCSAAWYWYWLMRRWDRVPAAAETGTAEHDEAREVQAGGKRG